MPAGLNGLVIAHGEIAGVAVEQLAPMQRERRVILYVPGEGEFGPRRNLSGLLAIACRARVILPTRPLEPEELVDLRQALAEQLPAEQLVVIADTSAANLAISVIFGTRSLGVPRALVLLSPHSLPVSLEGLPPTLVQISERELGFDAGRVIERVEASEIDIEVEVYANLHYLWQRGAPMLPNAIEAIERVGEFVDFRFVERPRQRERSQPFVAA